MNETTTINRNKRMAIWIGLAIVLLSPLLVMAIFVDDWSRDLSTNVAWTESDAADKSLRPLIVDKSVMEIADSISDFQTTHPNWSEPQPPVLLPEDSPIFGMSTSPQGEMQFHLVRKTALLGFKDDIWVVAEPIASCKTILHFESRSRVGKGDLGQNPRNIQELRGWLQQALK